MSNNLFPVPVETPISDDQKYSGIKFGAIWMRFFKVFTDDMLAANIVYNTALSSIIAPGLTDIQRATAARACKYTINANICTMTYDNTESPAFLLNLPYTALLAFDINGVRYPAGTKQVSIPLGVAYTRFWFVVQFAKQGVI